MQRHDPYQPMKALGLPLAGDMDYSGLDPKVDAISTMLQKVIVNVDQKGTEAAVATGIGGILMSPQIGTAQMLVSNRPYLLVIQDTKTGTPLCLARGGDPTGH